VELSVLARKEHGATEVRALHAVKIDHHEMLYAEQNQVLEHLVTEGSAAHYHHSGLRYALTPKP
jgi:hypothetical protein